MTDKSANVIVWFMFASQFCLWVHVTVVMMWQRGGYYQRVAQFCVVVLAPACLLISVAVPWMSKPFSEAISGAVLGAGVWLIIVIVIAFVAAICGWIFGLVRWMRDLP